MEGDAAGAEGDDGLCFELDEPVFEDVLPDDFVSDDFDSDDFVSEGFDSDVPDSDDFAEPPFSEDFVVARESLR